jgi:hypothetical protein
MVQSLLNARNEEDALLVTQRAKALVALLDAGAALRDDQPTALELRQAIEKYDACLKACEEACKAEIPQWRPPYEKR